VKSTGSNFPLAGGIITALLAGKRLAAAGLVGHSALSERLDFVGTDSASGRRHGLLPRLSHTGRTTSFGTARRWIRRPDAMGNHHR
jgi:hypothetical protein